MNPYKAFHSFLFRTPYFPFDAISRFSELQNESIFEEMLQIASPDLYSESSKTENGKSVNEDRALYSRYRYFQRAFFRPTPFELFAGCSVETIGEYTEIMLPPPEMYTRHTRLDMNYICALIQKI